VVGICDAKAHFDIDEFNDLTSRQKPTLYIKMADIFAIHHLVGQEIQHMSPHKDDQLRELVHELGSAKNNEDELQGVRASDIRLTLNPKYHDAEGMCFFPSLSNVTRKEAYEIRDRPGRRGQSTFYGDQAVYSVHHTSPDGR